MPYPRPMKTRNPTNFGSRWVESDTLVSRASPIVTIMVAAVMVSLSLLLLLLIAAVMALPRPVAPSMGSIRTPAIMGLFPLTTCRRSGTAKRVARNANPRNIVLSVVAVKIWFRYRTSGIAAIFVFPCFSSMLSHTKTAIQQRTPTTIGPMKTPFDHGLADSSSMPAFWKANVTRTAAAMTRKDPMKSKSFQD